MMKSFAAMSIFALLLLAATALPSFAPAVQASEAAVLAKGDRLALGGAGCTTQVWPEFTSSCLRSNLAGSVVQARLVTSRR